MIFSTKLSTIKAIKKTYNGKRKFTDLSFVFNNKKSSARTAKFVPICSAEYILAIQEKLAKAGIPITWEVRGVNNTYDKEKMRTQRHILVIKPQFEGCEILGLGEFVILAMNACDGTTYLDDYSGFNVNACSNGMVFGKVMENNRTKHIYCSSEQVIKEHTDAAVKLVKEVARNSNHKIREQIFEMSKMTLTKSQALDFAKKAFYLKISQNKKLAKLDPNKNEGIIDDLIDTNAIISVMRPEHEELTLWNVFQNVQENLRGNLDPKNTRVLPDISYAYKYIDTKTGKLKTRNSSFRKASKRVENYQKFNEELADLVKEYLPEKLVA